MAFALQYRCHFGQNLSILGSSASLGNWDTGQCVDMQWTEDDIWKVEVELPSVSSLDAAIEYKYIVRDENGEIVAWKPGDNYMLRVPLEDASEPERVRISDAWDNSCRQIEVDLYSANQLHQLDTSKVQIEESAEEQAAKEQAEAALRDLRNVVEQSTAILDKVDPTSPEARKADREVALAAEKAQKLTKALNEFKRSGLLKSSDS